VQSRGMQVKARPPGQQWVDWQEECAAVMRGGSSRGHCKGERPADYTQPSPRCRPGHFGEAGRTILASPADTRLASRSATRSTIRKATIRNRADCAWNVLFLRSFVLSEQINLTLIERAFLGGIEK